MQLWAASAGLGDLVVMETGGGQMFNLLATRDDLATFALALRRLALVRPPQRESLMGFVDAVEGSSLELGAAPPVASAEMVQPWSFDSPPIWQFINLNEDVAKALAQAMLHVPGPLDILAVDSHKQLLWGGDVESGRMLRDALHQLPDLSERLLHLRAALDAWLATRPDATSDTPPVVWSLPSMWRMAPRRGVSRTCTGMSSSGRMLTVRGWVHARSLTRLGSRSIRPRGRLARWRRMTGSRI